MNENKGEENKAREGKGAEKIPPKDELVETKHTLTMAGQSIPYTVVCGRMILKEEAEKKGEAAGESEGEKPRASVFFVAYTREYVTDKASRPITFSFNGGPGSSSVWLHLGLLGPRRVLMDDVGNPLPPPYRLGDNEFSLLDVTDLVFIDPVSTGFSRVLPGEKASEYHGFKKDIESVGDFIHLYTSRYQRWTSPKFLIGESYGTTRASGLSGYLQDRHGMYLNGIMLVSAVLNFQTIEFETGNDLPYILFLPTYTATAWYHKRLPEDLQGDLKTALEEAEAFALGDYSLGLMKGSALSTEERQDLVTKVARYTGLTPEYVDRSDLRIEIFRFIKELLRDEGRTVGRLDSRFKGYDRDTVGEKSEFDPSMANIMGPYTAMFNQYVRSDLHFESDLPYEVLTPKVWPWSYSEHENRYVNVAETLRKAITANPYLKVFIGNGYYDLATPYLATEYTFNHLGLPEELHSNISMGYYEAGHMMYIHRPSLAQLKTDLVNFVQSALPETPE
ncbi:MAG: S10 family peptidase [Omnitrophica WOR_2 bacterium]